MAKVKLPSWAVVRDDGVIEVDPAGFYPAYLKALGVEGEPDQYDLEIAYQCMKLDAQVILCSDDSTDPRATQKIGSIHIINRPEWAHAKFKKGKGAEAANKMRPPGDPYGSDVREAYLKMRKGQHPLLGRRRDPVARDDEIKPAQIITP